MKFLKDLFSNFFSQKEKKLSHLNERLLKIENLNSSMFKMVFSLDYSNYRINSCFDNIDLYIKAVTKLEVLMRVDDFIRPVDFPTTNKYIYIREFFINKDILLNPIENIEEFKKCVILLLKIYDTIERKNNDEKTYNQEHNLRIVGYLINNLFITIEDLTNVG